MVINEYIFWVASNGMTLAANFVQIGKQGQIIKGLHTAWRCLKTKISSR